jgi:hypothetical protein
MVHRLTPEQRHVASRMIRARLVAASLHLRAKRPVQDRPHLGVGGTPLFFDGQGGVRAVLATSEPEEQLAEAFGWLDRYIRPVIERSRRPGATDEERKAAHRAAHAFEAVRLWVRTQTGQTDESLNAILIARRISTTTFKRRFARGIRMIKQGLLDEGKIVVPPVRVEAV